MTDCPYKDYDREKSFLEKVNIFYQTYVVGGIGYIRSISDLAFGGLVEKLRELPKEHRIARKEDRHIMKKYEIPLHHD